MYSIVYSYWQTAFAFLISFARGFGGEFARIDFEKMLLRELRFLSVLVCPPAATMATATASAMTTARSVHTTSSGRILHGESVCAQSAVWYNERMPYGVAVIIQHA